jgi:alpha-galactosidase
MVNEPVFNNINGLEMSLREESSQKDVFTYKIKLKVEQEEIITEEDILCSWSFPFLDCAGVWHPNCGFNRSVNADWDGFCQSMTASSAPVLALFSEDNKNRITIAVSETMETIRMKAGLHEEDGTILLQVAIPSGYVITKRECDLCIRLDVRRIPFYDAIAGVSKWWEKECRIVPIEPGDNTREPVYSTWYSYHQNLKQEEIEEECKQAAELGFRTVILDDGWQTDDNNRGYAYCGDWEVSKNRFLDFAHHVEKIHNLGMNYMIWYSVPFVGSSSNSWEMFQDKLLSYNEALKAGVLDPRYPQVREYLVGIYEKALKEWGIEGFKLDFIDQLVERANSAPVNDQMDKESVQEALDVLMSEVYRRLSEIKPEVMIEFRQRYIGPNMRKYGNMFRVTDCPGSAISNRVGIVDLRMLSGNTTVHSDPLMWNANEEPRIAALQIISSIFSTVQISVKLEEITDSMKKMISYWLKFMVKYKEILQGHQIKPMEPHNLYPEVWTDDENTGICAVYTQKRIITIPSGFKENIVLNGTKAERLFLEFEKECDYLLEVRDCMGDRVSRLTTKGRKGISEIYVPVAGQIFLSRLER